MLGNCHGMRNVDDDGEGFAHDLVHFVEKRRLANVQIVKGPDTIAFLPADLEAGQCAHEGRDILGRTGVAASHLKGMHKPNKVAQVLAGCRARLVGFEIEHHD